MPCEADRLYERLLVIRCQAGDEASFVELVGRYQPRLLYYTRKLLGRSGAADDLVQEVWLQALRGLPRLRDAAAFPAWIYRIARDRVYQELRRSGDLVAPLEEGEIVEDQQEVYSAEEIGLVQAGLDEVSPEHREVLVLRFMEGMSYEQIGAVAGCDVGTVRSRLHYAKRALRRIIERKQSHD